MTQRDLALAAADSAFQEAIENTFRILHTSLITAHGDAEIDAAVDRAKRGVQACLLTRSKCKEIAQIVPEQ
jgi:hypothetical protein